MVSLKLSFLQYPIIVLFWEEAITCVNFEISFNILRYSYSFELYFHCIEIAMCTKKLVSVTNLRAKMFILQFWKNEYMVSTTQSAEMLQDQPMNKSICIDFTKLDKLQ